MDWYLPSDTRQLGGFRRDLRSYLDRHVVPGGDVDGAILAASELVTNAMTHGEGPVWVSLDWGAPEPVLSVHDLGPSFDLDDVELPAPDAVGGRGLMISAQVVADLKVCAKQHEGNTVTGVLPVQRVPSPSFDPDPSTGPRLPGLEEADEEGRFGLQPFLRALVVQLAAAAERDHGPTAVERLVSQVGANVGAQIEAAHRAAAGDDEPFDVDGIADLLVELKSAIHGEFFVIEADEERIVLGNRHCPFGEAVQHAPSLCRMTSSVFGGIARRNRGAAAVDVSQRIAVGDPECRVTVWLREPDAERLPFVHVYGSFDDVEPGDDARRAGEPTGMPVAMLGTPPR